MSFFFAGLSDEECKRVPKITEMFSAREREAWKALPNEKTKSYVYRSLILQSLRLDPNMRVSASNTHFRRRIATLCAILFEAREQLRVDWENGYFDNEEDDKSGNRPERLSKASLVEGALEEILYPDTEFEAGAYADQMLSQNLPFAIPDNFESEKERKAWITRQRRKLAEENHWFGDWTIEQMVGLDPPPDSGSGN